MKSLTLIKNAYLAPARAFEERSLEQTFPAALAAAMALLALSGAIFSHNPRFAAVSRDWPWLESHRALLPPLWGLLALSWLAFRAWVLRAASGLLGLRLPFLPLISGVLWIAVAAMPAAWLLGVAVGSSLGLGAAVIFWEFVLTIFLVRSLGETEFPRAALACALAALAALTAAAAALAAVVAVATAL